MANDKDFRVKNGILVATDNTDLNSQGQIINSGSLGSFINFVDINTEFPETKATIGGNIDLDFSAYSYKINDNNMLWHGEGYVDTNTVVGKNAGTTTDYTSSNLTLLGHGAEPSSPTATNEVTLGDSNVKSFRIPGVGMSVDSTGLLTVNDISISGDITIDSDLVVNTIQVNDSASVSGNFTVDSDTLHVDATTNRVGVGTIVPNANLHVEGTGSPQIRVQDADGTNQYATFGFNNGLLAINSRNDAGDGSIAFRGLNSSSEFMRIDAAGNVGIGTTSPSSKLEVVAASSLDTALGVTIRNTNSTNDYQFELGVGYPGYYDNSAIIKHNNTLTAYINAAGQTNFMTPVLINTNKPIQSQSGGDAQLNLYDPDGNTILGYLNDLIIRHNGNEVARVDSAGNVGIGTSSPQTALDVNGTVTADQYNNDESMPTSNPSLSLDFGNSVQIDPRINFSRASIGTYFDGQYIRTAGPDEPRIEYDSDGTVKGLLIEEQRTNLIQSSQDLTDISWSAIGIPTPTAISDGPYGLPAFEVTGLDTSGDRLDYATGTAAQDGKTYTYSCWLKGSGTIKITVNSFTGVGGSNEIPITLTDEWVRHSVTHTFSNPTGNVRAHAVITRTTGTAPTVYIAGPQIEEGSFPTSYIPTNGTEVTREPDIAYMPVSEFNYNQSAGTVVVDFVTLATFGSRTNDGVFSLRDNSTDRDDLVRLYLAVTDNLTMQVRSNNSTVFATTIQTDLPEQSETKAAIGFTSGSYAASVEGGAAQSLSTDTAFPVAGEITELAIGEINGNDYLNGHIRSLKYWPQRLSDATLQAVTQG